jgi:hypothetical protein
LAVAHELNEFVKEAMARALCGSPWRTHFEKKSPESQPSTHEYTVPPEIALNVASTARHNKPRKPHMICRYIRGSCYV